MINFRSYSYLYDSICMKHAFFPANRLETIINARKTTALSTFKCVLSIYYNEYCIHCHLYLKMNNNSNGKKHIQSGVRMSVWGEKPKHFDHTTNRIGLTKYTAAAAAALILDGFYKCFSLSYS